MLGPGYFERTGGEMLCFGAGGAGQAITLYLLTRSEAADRPSRVVITNRSHDRLESLRELSRQLSPTVPIEYVQTADASVNDRLVAGMPPHSLIINATGMGKDTPGSPLTSNVSFPLNAIAWDLNYRGELDFLRQAQNQVDSSRVRVEDGWQYFVYGWTTVIEEVFERPISPDETKALEQAAEFARPAPAGSMRNAEGGGKGP
jgi:shikimate 5-dehydrogenase